MVRAQEENSPCVEICLERDFVAMKFWRLYSAHSQYLTQYILQVKVKLFDQMVTQAIPKI